MTTIRQSLAGQLLLSMPGIGDPRFERSVIAMCIHDENGALGLNVGHVLAELTVPGLMQQLEIDPGVTPRDAPVHAGGPVERTRGFVLHTCDYESDGTITVGDSWALSTSLGVLKDIAAGRGPSRWLMALGYAGWGEGQLEAELMHHGWLALPSPNAETILFETPVENRWTSAFASLGVDVRNLSSTVGRA